MIERTERYRELLETKERRTPELLRRRGVIGVGVGRDEIVVLAERGVSVEREIEGRPVRIIRTGKYRFLVETENEVGREFLRMESHNSLQAFTPTPSKYRFLNHEEISFLVSDPGYSFRVSDRFYFNATVMTIGLPPLGAPVGGRCWWLGSVPNASGGNYKVLYWRVGDPNTLSASIQNVPSGCLLIFNNYGHPFHQTAEGLHTGVALYRYEGGAWVLKDYQAKYVPVGIGTPTVCPHYKNNSCTENCRDGCINHNSWWYEWFATRKGEQSECINEARSRNEGVYYSGRPCYHHYNKPREALASGTLCRFWDLDPKWPVGTEPSPNRVKLKCYKYSEIPPKYGICQAGCNYWYQGRCNYPNRTSEVSLCEHWVRDGDHFRCTKYGYKGYEFICRYLRNYFSFYHTPICLYGMDRNRPSLEETKPRSFEGVVPPPACSSYTTESACIAASCYWWGSSCHSLPEPTEGRLKTWRPCPPGTAIAVKGGLGRGTFGAVVLKGGLKKILSNNHVLAAFGTVEIGAPVYQSPASKEVLANLESFISLSASNVNTVDCALASPISQDDIIPSIIIKSDSYEPFFIPKGVEAAYVNQKLVKSGASSGYTQGEVYSTDSTVKVTVFNQEYTFDHIIICSKPLASPGDSGSLFVDKDTLKAVGLCFAGSDTSAAACDIQSVLDALGCTLYTTGVTPPQKSYINATSSPSNASIWLKKH